MQGGLYGKVVKVGNGNSGDSAVGLAYTDNAYDTERYERLRQLSAEIIAEKSNIPLGKVKDLFCNETGYQTPHLDTRAAFSKREKYCWFTKRTARGRCRADGATFCNR